MLPYIPAKASLFLFLNGFLGVLNPPETFSQSKQQNLLKNNFKSEPWIPKMPQTFNMHWPLTIHQVYRNEHPWQALVQVAMESGYLLLSLSQYYKPLSEGRRQTQQTTHISIQICSTKKWQPD